MAKLRSLLAALALLTGLCFGQDVILPASSSSYQVVTNNTLWASVNANYIFNPSGPDSTVCVFVTNNNPTNSHSLTLALQQTGDQQVTTYANQTGKWAPVPISGATFPAIIATTQTQSFFFRSSAAARLALIVSGGTSAGGNPDTVNINIVQPSTASFCGSAGLAGTTVIALGPTPPLSNIPAVFQSPVQTGGEGLTGSNYNGAAYIFGFDTVTKGVAIGALNSLAEASSPPAGISPSPYNNGSNFVGTLYTTGIGQDTDTAWGQGAGDTAGVMRVSLKYGLMTTNSFGWSSDVGSANKPLATFSTQFDSVNPAAGQVMAGVQTQSAPVTNGLRPYRFIIGCSAACDVKINKTNTAGTTCTAGTVNKTWDSNLTGPAATNIAIQSSCVASPNVQYTIAHLWIAAGTSQTFDATGYYWVGGAAAGNGFDVVEGGALTGTASITIEWIER